MKNSTGLCILPREDKTIFELHMQLEQFEKFGKKGAWGFKKT